MPKASSWLIAAMAILLVIAAGSLIAATPAKPLIDRDAVVKVRVAGGHGSGVHIGGGYVLTAGHVATDNATVTVMRSNGGEMDAEVLWSNHGVGAYDVSLLYAPEMIGEASASLSCAPYYWGQDIIIVGNPRGTEFATTWGKVSGQFSTDFNTVWRDIAVIDISVFPGVSGGPVFDAVDGAVVGLLVGGYRGSGYAVMVPGSAVCHMMGRAS